MTEDWARFDASIEALRREQRMQAAWDAAAPERAAASAALRALQEKYPNRDPRVESTDPVARLLAQVHHFHDATTCPHDEDCERCDHLTEAGSWCAGCSAYLELAGIPGTDERLGIGAWGMRW